MNIFTCKFYDELFFMSSRRLRRIQVKSEGEMKQFEHFPWRFIKFLIAFGSLIKLNRRASRVVSKTFYDVFYIRSHIFLSCQLSFSSSVILAEARMLLITPKTFYDKSFSIEVPGKVA